MVNKKGTFILLLNWGVGLSKNKTDTVLKEPSLLNKHGGKFDKLIVINCNSTRKSLERFGINNTKGRR